MNNTSTKNNVVISKENILEIKNLTKKFGKKVAVDNLSLSVRKGELFGFLGVNGAGKSTTLNIILGLLNADAGSITINGVDCFSNVDLIRSQIGIVFQNSIMDTKLSVYDNLYFRAQLYQSNFKGQKIKEVVAQIIEEFELKDFQHQKYGSLSGGQKRRVDIARALIHKPSILFLDEPTTGLDPNSRKLVWEILEKIQIQRQLTIILTTHYMEEANNCNRAIIISKGKILASGTPAELKYKYAPARIKVYSSENKTFESIFEKESVKFKLVDNSYYELEFQHYDQAKEFLNQYINIFETIEIFKGDMDEVFLKVTKGEKNESQ
ncbi:ABC transporter ATP-binding protein [Mycoplasmopsis sturni]|uniref:ABC transporter ATP-binding protein n=1 Tax=Mycoplasmopsis sturni TaxID=39047 RepID=UPI00055F7D60|nr:ABC transporter ATP-binding protein [Mycoplasmopsis sturni]